jgi:hypothetical protein
MTVRVRLLVLCLALGMLTVPARADLFGFSFSNVRSTFNSTTMVFEAKDWANPAQNKGTAGDVYRNITPPGTASFSLYSWNVGGTLEDILFHMQISNVTATTAEGSGWFTIKDIEGDMIGGNISGDWVKAGTSAAFVGTLSNVTYTAVVNDTFDGHSGSVSMVFPENQPAPWNGTLVELSAGSGWFRSGVTNPTLRSFDVTGGSLDATVVPIPAAVLLGLLGMGAAGLKLRQFA